MSASVRGTAVSVRHLASLSDRERDRPKAGVRFGWQWGAWLPDVLGILAAQLACVPVWLPWVSPTMDLLQLEDGLTYLIRLYHLGFLLEHGAWYPRWAPDMFLGYGYPIFNFVAPAFYYLSWMLGGLLRLGVWDAFRAGTLCAALLGIGGMYCLARRLWGRIDVAVLAVCFGYLPYVFHVLLYKRGDVPEFAGLMAIPWLLLAIYAAWQRGSVLSGPGRRLAAPLVGLVAAGAVAILAHNLTAIMAAIVAAVMTAALLAGLPARKPLLPVICGAALIVFTTAWFWTPAVVETRFVHLQALDRLFVWHGWLTDPAGRPDRDFSPENRQTPTGWIDTNLRYPNQIVATPKLSLAQVLLLSLTFGALIPAAARAVRRPTARLDAILIAGFLTLALFFWFLTLKPSGWLWDHAPVLRYNQFPSRMFGAIGVCLPVAASGALAVMLRAIERRWPGLPGRAAGLTLLAGLGLLVAYNGGADRHLPLVLAHDRTIGAHVVRSDERSFVDVGTTGNREFLPLSVQVPEYTAGIPRYRDVLERLYPEAEWLGGLFLSPATPASRPPPAPAWESTPTQTCVSSRCRTRTILAARRPPPGAASGSTSIPRQVWVCWSPCPTLPVSSSRRHSHWTPPCGAHLPATVSASVPPSPPCVPLGARTRRLTCSTSRSTRAPAPKTDAGCPWRPTSPPTAAAPSASPCLPSIGMTPPTTGPGGQTPPSSAATPPAALLAEPCRLVPRPRVEHGDLAFVAPGVHPVRGG